MVKHANKVKSIFRLNGEVRRAKETKNNSPGRERVDAITPSLNITD